MHPDTRPTIAHVIDSLAPGGTERLLMQMLHAWGTQPFRHVVVTLRDAGPLAENLPDHTACRGLHTRGRARTAWWQLARVLRGARASIIHARGAGCWSDAMLASMLVPSAALVLGFHGWDRPNAISRSARWAARFARRNGGGFLTVSEHAQARLAVRLRIPPHEIQVLSNGVDAQRFRPAGADTRPKVRATLGIAPDDIVVGSIGALTAVKRHDRLLEAFAQASTIQPSLILLIAGDGPLRTALEAQANALGLAERVRWLGWRNDVASLLHALDIYVCTSDSEGQSNALLEALASGVPAISTPVGDHAGLLGPLGAGLVVDQFDSHALAGGILRLAADAALRSDIGQRVRMTALQHDFFRMAARYQSYYQTRLPRAQSDSASISSAPYCPVLVP